jgi:hypothetical protein
MKKTIKSNPLKTFNDNKSLAVKKMGGAQASFKKKLPKAQYGTAFQDYMKIPGAVASDTVVKSSYKTPEDLKQIRTTGDSPRYYDKPVYLPAKNPKNQKSLDNARNKTYGEERFYEGTPNKDETIEQYMRRMGPSKQKMGGSTSSTKMKKGGVIKSLSKAQYGKSVVSDNTRVDNPYKTKYPVMSNKKKDPQELSIKELDALSHQRRGMGESYGSYVKKSGSIMNDLGQLTPKQQTQLKKYMGKASIGKKIYEALPNIGRLVGVSAADIPKGSKLEKQKKGGVIKFKKK